ncbi:MAG: ribonuclease III [Parvularculaceae bacterium]|nr:MAG: ribonuclease III [Parvularculaceae bacterium]
MTAKHVDNLERRIGYRFQSRTLLMRALTHSSLSSNTGVGDWERLEFLGDRVLGLLTAEALWRRYPEKSEGQLAPRLNALVRKETCAQAAISFGLDHALRLAPHEEQAGGRQKTSILGDVCEAFLGALYIDGGLEAARKAYDLFWTENLDRLYGDHQDPKTALQEWSQERGRGTPKYVLLKAEGPDHAPEFLIKSVISGAEATGRGKSKRAAQMDAARNLLLKQGAWSEHAE